LDLPEAGTLAGILHFARAAGGKRRSEWAGTGSAAAEVNIQHSVGSKNYL
jgi:hypothetical protein